MDRAKNNKSKKEVGFAGFVEEYDIAKKALFSSIVNGLWLMVKRTALRIINYYQLTINYLLRRVPKKYQFINTTRRRRAAGLIGILIISGTFFLQTLIQIRPPAKLQLTDLPYQEKVADGVWKLKNREPIRQVLAEGKKADLTLREIKNDKLNLKSGEGYRWSVTISSGTKFEFGAVDANTPNGKVRPDVKITNKEGWFVKYSPSSTVIASEQSERGNLNGIASSPYAPRNDNNYVTPVVKGNVISWKLPSGVVARYTMMQDRVKADYIINDKSNLKSNKLEFDVTSGNEITIPDRKAKSEGKENGKSSMVNGQSLKGELMPGGDIEWYSELVDSGGQTASQFTFPAPVVYDSKIKDDKSNLKSEAEEKNPSSADDPKSLIVNHKSSIDSSYEFKKTRTGEYLLAIVLDPNQVASATWPLTIDPVVIDATSTATGTAYGNGRKILRDAWGNLIAVVGENGGLNSDAVWYKAYTGTTWNDAGIDLDGTASVQEASSEVAADIDSNQNVHVAFYRVNALGASYVTYVKLTITRSADNVITGISKGTLKDIDTSGVAVAGAAKRPSLIVANKGGGVGVEKVGVAYAMNGTSRGEVRFMQRDVAKENYKNTILATSNLSGYWRLGESSGTNANDESATANDGTYQNTPTLGVAGAIDEDSDTAATFVAASSQSVTALDNDAYDFGTGNFSLEVWVNRAATPGTSEWILGHGGGGGATDWELYWRGTVDGFQSRISGATACNSGTGADITDSKWHHVVVTMDRAGLCTWYIDGQVSGTPTNISGGSATDLTNTSTLYIANRNPNAYYGGSLDEVAIYKGVALTASQVAQHYEAGTYAWKNASEEISGVGACSDTATSGAAGIPNAVTCKGTADKILGVATTTSHHAVLTQIPGKPRRSPASVKKDINGTFTTLSNTIDNNTGTTDNVNSLTSTDYLYVGDDKPFSKVTFDITNNNTMSLITTKQYWNGASWTSLSNFIDNTEYQIAADVFPFDNDGSFLFDEPSDWSTTTVDGVSGKYWIRYRPSSNFDATVSIAEVYVNDRNSKALLVVGGVDSTDDLGAAYVVWDEVGNAGWEDNKASVGAPWRSGITALDTLGGNWTGYANFPLSATVDYKNNNVYVGYVEDTTTDVLHVKNVANNKDPTVAANWTDTAFPTVTEAADLSLSLTADESDIYMFYVLDAGTNSLVFRRCTGSGGGLGGICDNSADWGSEKTLDNTTDVSHPQAVVTKVTGDTVAIDTIYTMPTALDVVYERHYVDLMDKTVVVAASGDDALHRDCTTGTDDQDITGVNMLLGGRLSDGLCGGGTSDNHSGLRFSNITVSQGAVISSAYIDFRVNTRSGALGAINFTAYGEDVDNSATFTAFTDCADPCANGVNTRTKTTSSTAQSVDFVANTYRIDVTDLVQEIVCRGAANSQPCVGDFNGSGTWASGNALAILLISTEGGGAGDNYVLVTAQDTAGTVVLDPTLQINLGSTGKNYSLGSAVQLATGSASLAVADLDHPLSSVEYGAVGTDDTNYASVSATTNYASQSAQPAFMFKVNNSNNDNTYKIDAQTIVKSTVPTSSKPIYLQVYRGGTTDNWVTMVSNNNTAVDTDITLTSPTIDTNTSEYYFNETPGIGTRYAECTTATANCWTYWRVYQDNPTTTFNDVLSVDYVNIVFTANGPDKIAFSNAARTLTAAACNGAASVFTMEIQSGTTPTNPLATTVVRVTSNSSNYTIYSDDTCSTTVTNGDFTYTTSQNTKSVYIIDNKKSVTTRTLTGTRQSGDVLTTGTQNYTVNAGAVSKLVITLPGQTFTDGTGNSGTVTNQLSGIRFPMQINATDANFNVNTSYTGDKVLVFTGPGVGSATPTVLDKNDAAVNYGSNTTITLSSGTAANILTTLYKGESITITATDTGSYGNASATLTIDAPNTKIRGGTTIRGGTKIQ